MRDALCNDHWVEMLWVGLHLIPCNFSLLACDKSSHISLNILSISTRHNYSFYLLVR